MARRETSAKGDQPPRIRLVDLKAQYATIGREVEAAIQRVLRDSRFVLGPQVESFERQFADYCGVRHCVGVGSGTDALHLILRGLNIGPGDEVVVPAFTFVASALSVSLAGATPVLADVGRDDALIDPDRVDEAITHRTKAIVAVHLYGRCADMQGLRAVAERHELKLIEDACQAHGARYHARCAGSLGDAAAFSFFPSKNLGAYGDGGAVTTDDDALCERLRSLRNWGSRKKYHHEHVGMNSRLDALQAAVLQVKLQYLSRWNEQRRVGAAMYDRLLARKGKLSRPADAPDAQPVYHLYVIRVGHRQQVIERMHAHGVEAGIHYPLPLHRLGAYRCLAPSDRDLPESEAWARQCLSLPLYPELTEEQIVQVVELV